MPFTCFRKNHKGEGKLRAKADGSTCEDPQATNIFHGAYCLFVTVSLFARKGKGRDFQNSLKDWSEEIAFNFSESKAPKHTGPLEILAIEYNSREQSQRLQVILWVLK